MTLEEIQCPRCRSKFNDLANLFQHFKRTDQPGHTIRTRWVVIDRKDTWVYLLDDVPGLKIRDLQEHRPKIITDTTQVAEETGHKVPKLEITA